MATVNTGIEWIERGQDASAFTVAVSADGSADWLSAPPEGLDTSALFTAPVPEPASFPCPAGQLKDEKLAALISERAAGMYSFKSGTAMFDLAVLFTGAGEGYLLFARSILAGEIVERVNELKLSGKTQAEFISSLNHQIRSPLNSIMGFTDFLRHNSNLNMDEVKESLEVIADSAGQMTAILDSIFELVKLEHGKLPVKPKPVQVGRIIEDVISELQPRMETCNLDLEQQLASLGDTRVMADPFRLRQVFFNLLTNAINYNKEDGHITIKALVEETSLVISIADTGIGIPESRQHLVFQPFERLEMEGSILRGTGVGLALVRHLVSTMAGEVWFESVYGQGSTFSVRLPVYSEAGTSAGDDEAGVQTPRFNLLYIEDVRQNVMLLDMFLRKNNDLNLISVYTGAEGLSVLNVFAPDLVIVDTSLPDFDTVSLVDEMKKLQDIPVVVTGPASAGLEKELGERVSAWVDKPINFDKLVDCIYTILKK